MEAFIMEKLNTIQFVKQEKIFYKLYRKYKYSIKNAKFKAFHDTILFFKNN
jgi:hypothetical protein